MTDLLSKLFVKNNQNTSDPIVRRAYGTMVSITGIFVNVILFLAKFTIGTLTGSVAISADAVNNLSDAGSQIISLISFRIAAKPADREHPFGHARIEYVASMIVSFLILYIGIDLLTESIGKIFSPEPPEATSAALVVLLLSIFAKLWLGLFNKKIAKRVDSSVMRAAATDCFSDCLSTGAVLIATAIAFFFPSLGINLDAYMGVIVSALILVAGIKILNETKNSILGEAPSEEIVNTIHEIVKQYPLALGIHDLTVHNYGPGHVIASFHIEVDGNEDIYVIHDMADLVEQRLRREHGIEATVHMDPIVTDDETLSALRHRVQEQVALIDARILIHDFRFVPGETHTNLIFDVAVPYEIKLSDSEIKDEVAKKISEIDPSYFTVITVDRI